MTQRARRLLQNLLIALVSVVLTTFVVEVGYRVYTYRTLMAEDSPFSVIAAMNQPMYNYDRELGYRYTPNATVLFTWLDGQNVILQQHFFYTNNHGWVSRHDYAYEKATGEYRIAVLGDSFTANVESPVTWSDELRKLLNDDDALKAHLGVDEFSVLNFGMDGTGVVQFWTVFQREVLRYDPDLVIVNMIADNMQREFIWRRSDPLDGDFAVTQQCVVPEIQPDNVAVCVEQNRIAMRESLIDAPDALDAMRLAIYRNRVNNLPWWSPHSELLAMARGGGRLQLSRTPDLHRQSATDVDRYDLLARMQAESPAFLVFLQSTSAIRSGGQPSRWDESIVSRSDSIMIHMPHRYIPDATAFERQLWFNLPFDGHMSGMGNQVYAQAVYTFLAVEHWQVAQ